jgi:putative flippase GtrA
MPRKQPAKKKETPQELVKQGAKFGLVGISNTVIDFTIYTAITVLGHVPPESAYLVKYLSGGVAMFNSFYWNRRWVFASRANIGTSGVKFVVATLVSVLVIQPGMVRVFTATAPGLAFSSFWYNAAHAIGLTAFTHDFVVRTVAFGMGVVGSAIWNFTMYKVWAFREK